MRIINIEEIVKRAERLGRTTTSKDILFKSFAILSWIEKKEYQKKVKSSRVIVSILSIVFGIVFSLSIDTIDNSKSAFELLSGIQIALLAIVFTGYAFYQALINDKLLIAMIADGNDNTSKLEESNLYFSELMMIQVVCIVINVCAILSLIVMPDKWTMFSNNIANVFIASIVLFIVMYVNLCAIVEMISFVFNVFQLFNAHALTRVIEILQKKDDKK